MTFLTQFISPEILDTLTTWWYFVMFILMILEWPFITMAAAFLASLGVFNIFLVAFLGWLGDIMWDFLFFSIGRYGLKIFAKKTQIHNKKEENFIYKLDNIIDKNLFIAILIVKFIPYAPPIWLPYIGRSNISTKKFLIYTIIACLPAPIFATIIGFNIMILGEIIKNPTPKNIVIFIILATFLLWIIIATIVFIKKKLTKKLDEQTLISCETKNEKIEKTDE